MATRPPLSSQELQQIKTLHAQGWSLNRIAKELGRSTSTIGKAAKAAGLQWTSTRTALATEAKVQSSREKRATLEGRFLDEAALLLDQLHKPHHVYNFGGKDNTYEEHELSEPDVGAKRSLIQAAVTAVGQAIKLADVDAGRSGQADARGILGAFAEGLQRAYDQLPATEAEAPVTPMPSEG